MMNCVGRVRWHPKCNLDEAPITMTFLDENSETTAPSAVRASAQQGEPIYLSSVLFTKAENAVLCQHLLESGAVMTLTGVGPSGKPASCRGVLKSMNEHSLLHPGYPLMITFVETFPTNDQCKRSE